jgi:release factor glutamine methyltransferase
MTRKQALRQARIILASTDIEDAPLECELLLRHTLKISRVQLYIDLNDELSPEQEETFWHLVKRRGNGEPVAYITGNREFYGLDFYVDPRVLIPRPETELLVEKAINLARGYPIATIAEIGTGCGVIAICLALNLPQAKIYATDTSADALEVASINSEEYGVADRVCLLHGNMLAPLPEPVDLIVANLPYVRKGEVQARSFEPLIALDGGSDGLERIRELCRQLAYKLHPGSHLLLEVGQGQTTAVTGLLHSLFPGARVEVTPDLSGIDRVVSLKLTTVGDCPNQLDTELSQMLN